MRDVAIDATGMAEPATEPTARLSTARETWRAARFTVDRSTVAATDPRTMQRRMRYCTSLAYTSWP